MGDSSRFFSGRVEHGFYESLPSQRVGVKETALHSDPLA
jgi:hypothetical protein